MAKLTTTTVTKDGAWATLAAGECTVAALVATSQTSNTLITLRLTLANGAGALILPINTLEAKKAGRINIAGLSLATGDKLEGLSSDSVTWLLTSVPAPAYKSAVATSTSAAWVDLVKGPCVVRALYTCSVQATLANARVNNATQAAPIVTDEEVAVGMSKRLMMPIQLKAGDTLQVSGAGPLNWIATGVQA